MSFTRHVPLAAAVLTLAVVGYGALPDKPQRGFDVAAFGALPVLEGGRVKPLDSVARNSLLVIRSKQGFTFGARPVTHNEWLLDMLFRPDVADLQPVFVIDDPDVLGLIGLKQTSERYFSFEKLRPHMKEIDAQGRVARGLEAQARTRFQSAIANLHQRISLYSRLKNTMQLEGAPPLSEEIKLAADPTAAERREILAESAHFRLLPPPGGVDGEWHNVGEALMKMPNDPALAALARIGTAYRSNQPDRFNAAVDELLALSSTVAPSALRAARSELTFNRVQPFYAGMVVYVIALLLLFVSWLWRPEFFQKTAFALLVAGTVIHTGGLVARIVLQGRPPVTNLYSSAVFVGWGAVVLGVVLERMYRNGFGTAVAAASGFASLIVAHHLAADGDTMEMMRAVLDSNFWLATHVVTITIGYSGTFLAGALAIVYAIRRQVVRVQDPAADKSLVSMAYGVVAFSLFFSFVGTVLGGIWADQSWGRFWGWDPKENGALLIVLWNAIILHARLGGFIREKGFMAMAIIGNVITSLSWFGVNMLGVGLHSYGFMDKAFWSLTGFCVSQFVLFGICLMPVRGKADQGAPPVATTPPVEPATT